MGSGLFDYRKATPAQIAHMDSIRTQCEALVATLHASQGGSDGFVPEFKIAYERLQEFAMWANKGITHT